MWCSQLLFCCQSRPLQMISSFPKANRPDILTSLWSVSFMSRFSCYWLYSSVWAGIVTASFRISLLLNKKNWQLNEMKLLQGRNYGKRLFYAAWNYLEKHEHKRKKVSHFKSVYIHFNVKNVSKTALSQYIGTDTTVYDIST